MLHQFLEGLFSLFSPREWTGPQQLEEGETAILEIKRLRAAKDPVSFCTSLMRPGGLIASIALILAGFALMPRCENRIPSSFPAETPKTHFSGFSFVRVGRSRSKTRDRSSTRVDTTLVLTTMSSTYTSTISLIQLQKVLFIARTNVGKAFRRPYGMTI